MTDTVTKHGRLETSSDTGYTAAEQTDAPLLSVVCWSARSIMNTVHFPRGITREKNQRSRPVPRDHVRRFGSPTGADAKLGQTVVPLSTAPSLSSPEKKSYTRRVTRKLVTRKLVTRKLVAGDGVDKATGARVPGGAPLASWTSPTANAYTVPA